jgi:uncharacterized membrane protein YhiD involved in acid resistance
MLENLSVNHPLIEVIIAALLGAFLGIRREMEAQKNKKKRGFMGLRTMTLISVLGVTSTFFPQQDYLPGVF